MTLDGTVVNGQIVLDGAPRLPEGLRVSVQFYSEDLDDDETDAPFPQADSEEEILAALRESFEDVKAGRTQPYREVMQEILARHQLPPLPPE